MSGMHDDQERLTEALSAYLDGALDGAERDTLERHLATCETCRAELEELRRMRALLRALPEPALPRSFTLPVTTTRAGRPASRRVAAVARAAQWIGGLAATVGVGFLVAGAIQPPHAMFDSAAPSRQSTSSQGPSSAGTSASAPSSTTQNQDLEATAAARLSPTANAEFAGAGKTSPPSVTTPSATTPSHSPAAFGGENQSAGSPLIPAGATLLVGGGAALAAGTASRRRQRQNELAR